MFGNKVHNFSLEDLKLIDNSTTKSGMNRVNYQTQIVGESRYQITANTTHSGNISLSIMIRDQHINNSPFVVQVFPDEPQPQHTQASGTNLWESSVGTEGIVHVTVYDR